ncbi:MAG: lysostaphin resistance A-like protein [Akkermansiaceae bacterium]
MNFKLQTSVILITLPPHPMSMSADLVYSYAYLLCVAAFVCALLIYGLMRKNSPELAWHRHGKVSTSQFNQVDKFGIALILLIFGAIMVMAQAPPELDADGEAKAVKVTPMIMIVGMISQQLVFVFIVMALMMFRGTNFVELFGLRWKKARYLVLIAPVGVILVYVFGFALIILGYNEWLQQTFGNDSKLQETVRVYQEIHAVTIRIMMAFAVVILAPICEEILFRGYIYAATKRFTDRFFACLFSSLLFSVVHYNINALLPLLFLAVILAIAYELTGSLWAPISIHALFNASTLINLEMGNVPGS